MPGLVQQQMPQQAQQAPQGQPDPKMVERVVLAAAKIIHTPKVSDQLIAMMKAAGDPVQALSRAVITIMSQLVEKSGNKIPPDVVGAAGVQVLQLLGQLAETAGLFKFTMEIFQQAAKAAMDQVVGQQQVGPAAAPAQSTVQPQAA